MKLRLTLLSLLSGLLLPLPAQDPDNAPGGETIAAAAAAQAAMVNEAYALRGLRNQVTLNGSLAGQDLPLSLIKLGDSFGAGLPNLQGYANVRGSFRTGQATGGGDSGVSLHNDLLGVPRDHKKSPDGFYYEIANGGNLTAGHLQTGRQGPADRVYYTLFPGPGIADFDYSIDGGPWIPITNGRVETFTIPAGSAKVGFIPLQGGYHAKVRTRVRAINDTIAGWIGQGSAGPGVTYIDFATTGQDIGQSAGVTEAVWKAMIAGYGTVPGHKADIILTAFADHRYVAVTGGTGAWPVGTDNWADGGPIDTLRTWSRAANPLVDWLVLGPHRIDPAVMDAPDEIVDVLFASAGIGRSADARIEWSLPFIRDWALRRGEGYFDSYYLLPGYAYGQANGYYNDPIHFSATGNQQKFAALLAGTNLGMVLGRSRYGLGQVYLGSTRAYTDANPSGGVFYESSRTPAPWLTGELRVGSQGSESSYMKLWAPAQNTLAFGTPETPLFQMDPHRFSPVSDGGAALGSHDLRFSQLHAQGIRTGFAAKSAAYTLTATDHVILCTGAGNFTLTLPPTAPDSDLAPAGREYIIVNRAKGKVTLATSTDGSVPQKIDKLTKITLRPNSTTRLLSTGNLPSGTNNNWITW